MNSKDAHDVSRFIPLNAIPSLDGIRAFSFMLVFLSHAGLGHIVPGGLGVTIFFFLSGYLITTLLREEYESSGRVDFRNFYVRRALRILPPFYLILAIAVMLTLLIGRTGLNFHAVLAQILHLSNYWTILNTNAGIPMGTGVYWSLAVEEHFYLVFPLLFVTIQRMPGRTQAGILLSLCLAILIWRCALIFMMDATTDRTYLATDTRVDSILFGCAVAVYWNPVFDEGRLQSRAWLPLIVAALLAMILSLVIRDGRFRETLRYTVQGVALAPLFVFAIRDHRHWLVRWLNWGPVRLLGRLSFVLYLCHVILLDLADQYLFHFRPVERHATALIAALAVALLVRALVEQPCARISARFRGVRRR